MRRPVLEAQNLTKIYQGRRGSGAATVAAERVSFTLYKDEVLVLIGESGSGKTTVAKILTEIEQPTSGSVHWGDDEDGSGRAQMVFQDPYGALNPWQTVEYVLKRPLLNFGRATKRDVHQEVARLLETVQLTPAALFMTKRPHELSGGQRQRVVIARALAAHPKIIVSDEPVSMLDVSIRAEILRFLRDLVNEGHTESMLYITHDLLNAQMLADNVLVMYKGRIVESGDIQRILREPAHPYTQLLLGAIPNP